MVKNYLPMETETFLCQLVLATLANTIAGYILRNNSDGKHPSKHDNKCLKIKTSFEIHWNMKSKTLVWIIILLCSGLILLLWDK